MQFRLYDGVKAFYRDTHSILLRQEAQNVLLLGNLMIGYAGRDKTGWRDPAHWLMATVSDGAGIRLTALNPAIPRIGQLRLARESDMAFLPYWFGCFHSDCFGTAFRVTAESAEDSRYQISTQALYILEDHGTPVSMAKISRELETVCCVGFVYTPPYFRGKGYASACVAGVSRVILERGGRASLVTV